MTAIFVVLQSILAAWLGGVLGCATASIVILHMNGPEQREWYAAASREDRTTAVMYFVALCAIWPVIAYYALRERWEVRRG